jgi:hypothetical protein
VDQHIIHFWGTENHVTLEHERDSPKVNVLCAVSKEKVYGPFFCMEYTVMCNSFLDMLDAHLIAFAPVGRGF